MLSRSAGSAVGRTSRRSLSPPHKDVLAGKEPARGHAKSLFEIPWERDLILWTWRIVSNSTLEKTHAACLSYLQQVLLSRPFAPISDLRFAVWSTQSPVPRKSILIFWQTKCTSRFLLPSFVRAGWIQFSVFVKHVESSRFSPDYRSNQRSRGFAVRGYQIRKPSDFTMTINQVSNLLTPLWKCFTAGIALRVYQISNSWLSSWNTSNQWQERW